MFIVGLTSPLAHIHLISHQTTLLGRDFRYLITRDGLRISHSLTPFQTSLYFSFSPSMFAAAAFRDTFFAYTLRLAFGSRIFPHPDEKELPVIWESKLSTPTSPRDSVPPTLNGGLSPDARSIVSETTVIANTLAKADPEKGQDTLLVDWYGPTDPDVSIVGPFCKYRLSYSIRIRRTGRVGRRRGSCSRRAF
jgi:hypothetical protein